MIELLLFFSGIRSNNNNNNNNNNNGRNLNVVWLPQMRETHLVCNV